LKDNLSVFSFIRMIILLLLKLCIQMTMNNVKVKGSLMLMSCTVVGMA